MLASTILRATRLPIYATHLPQTVSLSFRRWIFNPSLEPPPTGPAAHQEFPKESRAHLSSEQFYAVRDSYQSTASLDTHYGMPTASKGSEGRPKETPTERWQNKAFRLNTQPSSTYAGRSTLVVGGDVAQAWSKLQAVLRLNNVRQELRMTERHEKKGVKRRRLRSERWRRKFADEVRKKVRLVNEIRLRDRMWGGSRH